MTFTIDGKEVKIPPAGLDHPTPIDLNPERYTFTISIPGGAANGQVTLCQRQARFNAMIYRLATYLLIPWFGPLCWPGPLLKVHQNE